MPRPRPRRRTRRTNRPPRPGSRRRVFLVGLVLGLALLALADRRGWLLVPPADLQTYDGRQVLVERVVDGDTLIVAVPDAREGTATTRVRLWGIDAPELARPFDTPPSPAEPLAAEAAEALRRLVEGREVRLILEPGRPRGYYGRVLAHVALPDGQLAAESLVVAGLARADDRSPHKYLDRLMQLQTRAQRDRLGLWGD
jgi:endonuclease YncB( thermonuclease family)